MAHLSLLAQDLGALIGALDINPIIVGPHGCAAVDALVEPSVQDASREGRLTAPNQS